MTRFEPRTLEATPLPTEPQPLPHCLHRILYPFNYKFQTQSLDYLRKTIFLTNIMISTRKRAIKKGFHKLLKRQNMIN